MSSGDPPEWLRIRNSNCLLYTSVAHARGYAESHFRLASQMQRTLDAYARAMART